MSILKNLTTKNQQKLRTGLIIGAIILIVIIIGVAISPDENKIKQNKKGKSEKGKFALLNDKIERESWFSAQGQNIKKLQLSNEAFKRDIESFQNQIDSLQQSLKDMELDKTRAAASSKADKLKNKRKDSSSPPLPKIYVNKSEKSRPVNKILPPKKLKELSQPKDTIKIYDDKSVKNDNKESDQEKNETKKPSIILSSGSFMKVVLLNGIDAPTDFGSKGEPYPVLMSIVDSTTLPNLYKMNLKNCFIIGAGYGNLADERAYIRTEKLSCITASSRVIDTNLKGHIVGEDGKLGMRGRLISKQGQLLAKSLLSGTFAGLGEAFKPEKTVSINLDPNGSPTYIQPDVEDFLKAGGAQGASTALNKIADFYLKMAEKVFPIIEIDAGRVVEVLVLSETQLTIGNAIDDSKGGGS